MSADDSGLVHSPQMTAARAAAILLDCRTHGTITPEAVDLLDGYVHTLANECNRLGTLNGALRNEYGILDDGGGDRQARTEPIPLAAGNAAMAVELRAKGVFAPGGRRPARLMQRKATGWTEIPPDVQPDDILPGYTEVRAQREAEA